jgi:PAS domain S-box-containing protein
MGDEVLWQTGKIAWASEKLSDHMKATSSGREKSVEGLLRSQTTAADVTAQKRGDEVPGRSYDELEQRLAGYQDDLSRLERFLDALLSNNPDTIYFKDRESRFVRVSKSKAEKTLQTARDNYHAAHPDAGPNAWPSHLASVEAFTEWLIGKTDFDTYPEAHARAAYADEQEIIRTGKPMVDKLEKATLPDGKTVWWLSTKLPWRDKEGNIIGTFGVSKDVTRFKEAEEVLAREHMVLRTLIDGLPDYLFVKDRQSRFLVSNQAHIQALAATRQDEVVGKTDLDIFPHELAKQYYDDEQAVMASGQPLNREEMTVNPQTQEKRWLQTTKIPLRDQDRKVIGLMGISRDITARKQAEEALRQSRDQLEKRVAERTADLAQANEALANAQRLLEAMLDNIPDRIYLKDTQGRFMQCNRAVAQRVGVADPKQVVGKTDFDFYPREKAEEFYQDEQRIIRAGEPLLNKIEQVAKPDGETTWSSVTKVPLRDKDGKVVGLVGISRNITEQKRAEETLRQSRDELEKNVAARTAELARERSLLRTLIDSLPDFIFIKDRQSRFQISNQAHVQALGATCLDEVVGKTDLDIFPHEMARQFYDDERAVMSSGQTLNREEIAVNPQTQEKRWLQSTKIPLRDKDGTIIGLMGISRNITPIKEANAKLEQVHKQLLETSRQAGMAEVATSVLHNVGNVLNSVNVASACVADSLRQSRSGNLSKVVALLREHEADLGNFITSDPKGKQLPRYLAQLAEHLAGEQTAALEKLDRLQKNVEHIREIIAMQQNYAKVSGVLESLPVADLVEDAVRMNTASMERHNIQVLREYAETPLVLVDKHKVLQILVNLIRNAKHACNDSGKTDKQIILRLVNGNERIKISVIDNGVGIPAENLTRIFNYGFTTRKDGHGFGLHNAALAAKEMGGSLAAFSEGPGRGAAFTLELPINNPRENL